MHLSVASVVLIVWCGVLPVLLTLRLWRARKSIAAGLKQPGLAPFYSHCKPSCYLWEVYSTLVSRAPLPLAPFLKCAGDFPDLLRCHRRAQRWRLASWYGSEELWRNLLPVRC